MLSQVIIRLDPFLSDDSNKKLAPHDSSKDFRTVFVSNLSFSVDEEQLKSLFCKASVQDPGVRSFIKINDVLAANSPLKS